MYLRLNNFQFQLGWCRALKSRSVWQFWTWKGENLHWLLLLLLIWKGYNPSWIRTYSGNCTIMLKNWIKYSTKKKLDFGTIVSTTHTRFCQSGGSNPQPLVSKSDALPIELPGKMDPSSEVSISLQIYICNDNLGNLMTNWDF